MESDSKMAGNKDKIQTDAEDRAQSFSQSTKEIPLLHGEGNGTWIHISAPAFLCWVQACSCLSSANMVYDPGSQRPQKIACNGLLQVLSNRLSEIQWVKLTNSSYG